MAKSECERGTLAFMYAPLVVPVCTCAALGLVPVPLDLISSFVFFAVAVIAYGSFLLLGLPLYLLLRKLNATAFVFAIMAGGVVGAATVWLVSSLSNAGRMIPSDSPLNFGAFIGAIAGMVFWAIARPDLPREGGESGEAQ